VNRAKDVLLRVLGFNLRAYMKAKVALSMAANYLFLRILKQPRMEPTVMLYDSPFRGLKMNTNHYVR
jgi:hypothetical protein